MDNIFVEENVSYDNLNDGIPKKKIILFSVLAACLPALFEELGTPVVYEIMSRNINISPVFMSAAGIFISFIAAVSRLVLLVAGGKSITGSKYGAVRFTGVFVFSAAIASCITGIFGFLEHAPAHTEIIEWFFVVLSIISALIAAALCIKLFIIFEYRAENRYVTAAEASLFRKKLIIFLVIMYAVSFITVGIVPFIYAMTGTEAEAVQPLLYVTDIISSFAAILIMCLIYKLAYGVRKVKADVIGFGSAYYIGGAVTAPATLLVTGLLSGLRVTEIDNYIALVQGFITMGLSLITGILSLVIMFKVLKIFFPVKEDPAPEPDDRAERILRNLIASKQDTDSEIN
ncbi:MAG: hypothetical protein IJN70_07675 [Clostridia bacterium]|nr:hypothetical protein [Clostridia bacterium]